MQEAMEAHSQDITKRMKDIKSGLDANHDSDEQVLTSARTAIQAALRRWPSALARGRQSQG